MAKRFTDTRKYEREFYQELPCSYKLLWDYLCARCDHAGVWNKNIKLAIFQLGSDVCINEEDALKYFNNGDERIIVLNGGSKWFIPDFIEFQYKTLNPSNKVHKSVIDILINNGIDIDTLKPLASPLHGAKDKDKKKAKVKVIVKDLLFDKFWEAYPKKKSKGDAEKAWKQIKPSGELLNTILSKLVLLKQCEDWTKDSGQFIPYPASWLRAGGWDDEVEQPCELNPEY